MITDVLQDVRQAIKSAAMTPWTTIVVVLTMAIGVGANTAMFSVIDGVLLRPLPYPDQDRIVQIWSRPPGFDRSETSTLNYSDWEHQSTAFEYMVASVTEPVTLSNTAIAVSVARRRVGPRFFELFGSQAAQGRLLAPDDYQPSRERVAILSHRLWQSQFGADPNVIGRAIRIDAEPYTVVGILPAGSVFDRTFEQVWCPLMLTPRDLTRDVYWLGVLAKLRRGVSLGQARAQMTAIALRLEHDHPESNKGWGIIVDRYVDAVVGRDLEHSLYLLLAAVGSMLVIACVNIATVCLARNMTRDREVATRAALGASPARLSRQFFTEALVLSLAGGGLGVGCGYALLGTVRALMPAFYVPPEAVIRLDGRVLFVTLAMSIATGLLVGSLPALSASRVSITMIFSGAAGYGVSSGQRHRRLSAALIVVQMSLAFVLLTMSGVLLQSLFDIQNRQTGIDSTNVVTAMLYFPQQRLVDPHLNTYLTQILERLRSLPGVRDVALTTDLPMRGLGWGLPCQILGRPQPAQTEFCSMKSVSPSYAPALGLRLLRGRNLSEHDGAYGNRVAVINETLAKKYFSTEDPLGQHVLVPRVLPGNKGLAPPQSWEVIGVIADERLTALNDQRDFSALYVTIEQGPPPYLGEGVVIRSSGTLLNLEESLRKAIREVNPDQPVSDVKTIDELKTDSMASDRFRSLIVSSVAFVAVLLSAIGIYGVVASAAAQRRREFAIRIALGATASHVRNLAVRSSVVATLGGLGIGVALVVGLRAIVASMLSGITRVNPLAMWVSGAVLAGTALLAAYIPTRHASNNPVATLRPD